MRLDPVSRSAAEQAALVREGRPSARELVDAALAAIDRRDPELNAFVLTCPERARAELGFTARVLPDAGLAAFGSAPLREPGAPAVDSCADGAADGRGAGRRAIVRP